MKLETGYNYLIYETKPKLSYTLFTDLLKSDTKGMVMTTTFPNKLKKKLGNVETKILWMSEAKAKDAVNPRRLDFEVTQELNRLLRDGEEPVILMDCFGYLVLANGFDKVRKFVKKTLDSVSINNGTFLMVLDPEAFSAEVAQAIAQDFDQVEDLRGAKMESVQAEKTKCDSCGASVKPGAFFCEICGYNLKDGGGRPAAAPSFTVPAPGPTDTRPAQQAPSPVPQAPPRQSAPPPPPVQQTATLPPGSVDWYSKGVQLERQGRNQEALEAYEKAVAANPSDVKSLFNKAVLLQILGRVEEAVAAYDAALRITPNDVEVLSNKGIALRSLGRIEEALRTYDQALDIDPTDSGVWSNKGVALRALGRTEESIACYQKALEYKPNDAGILSNLGVAYHKLGQLEKAVECYDKALRIDPGKMVARKNREIAMNQLGR